MRHVWLLALVLLLAAPLFAQAPAGQAGTASGNTIMLNTQKGLFVLRAGVLGKCDLATLKVTQELQLFGPAPEAPKEQNDRDGWTKYFTEIQRRNAAAIMLAKDDSLLIVVGDGFCRVNQDTLKVEATGDLKSPDAAAPETGRGFRMGGDPAPGYLLAGNTMYLMRSKELLSFSITDGKVLQRAPLPKELQPLQTNAPMGGGRGGAGAGAGGGRGGNGNGGGGR